MPIEFQFLADLGVGRDEHQLARQTSERERCAERGRCGTGRSNPGANADRNPGDAAGIELLGGAAEDCRVPAFKPHHPLPRQRGRDNQLVNACLIL